MNKPQLIAAVADKSGLSKVNAERALAALAKITAETLQAGEEVTLPYIGKLTTNTKPARTGRNPRAGAAVEIPAKTATKFKASKYLTDLLNA